MTSELSKIPYLGIGMGLRNEIADEMFANQAEISAVEVISEHFFSYRPERSHAFLERAKAAFTVIPHGISLSIGSTPPLSPVYLKEIRRLTDVLEAHYYSDHFCITRHDELTDIGHLSPLWYTKEMLEHLVGRIDTIQQYIGRPLILENITAPFIIPEADYEEPEFITEICRRTGCGLLLDVTNIFINAHNRKEDAQSLLERYPMKSVVQIHLAGGVIDKHGHYHDTHSARVHEGVWPLLEWVAEHASIKAVIIERDEDFEDDFSSLVLEDIARARSIVEPARTA